MTESEAKEFLISFKNDNNWSGGIKEALDMAINALGKQEKIKEVFTHYTFSENELDMINDCISALSEIRTILKE